MYNNQPNPESLEAIQKRNAERAAENGEIQNPYYESGFDDLAEIEFSGDDLAPEDIETPEENATPEVLETLFEAAAENPLSIVASEGLKFAGEQMDQAGNDSFTPTELQSQVEEDPFNSDNPVIAEYNDQYKAGEEIDLERINETIKNDYGEGGAEKIATDSGSLNVKVEQAKKEATDSNDDKPNTAAHDIGAGIAESQFAGTTLTEKAIDAFNSGDQEQALRWAQEAEQRNAEAQELANSLNSVIENNPDSEEAKILGGMAEQAINIAKNNTEQLNAAQAEFDANADELEQEEPLEKEKDEEQYEQGEA